jgi:hypothetical protein
MHLTNITIHTQENNSTLIRSTIIRVEVHTAVTVKVIVFWDAKSCPEDGGSRFLRDWGNYMQGEEALDSKRQ